MLKQAKYSICVNFLAVHRSGAALLASTGLQPFVVMK